MAGNTWEDRYSFFLNSLEEYPELFPADGRITQGVLVGEGHWPLVKVMLGAIQHAVDTGVITQPVIIEIREDNSELIIKYTNRSDYVDAVIDTCNAISKIMCSECGKPGRVRETPHPRTYCWQCADIHGVNKF